MKYQKQHQCKICGNKFIALNWRAEICSKECKLVYRRDWHFKNKDKINKKGKENYYLKRKPYYKQYEKTINGFLMRKYRNMKSRISGIQKSKFHLYKGKDLLDKQEFYKWSLNNKQFLKLYNNWVKNNYNRKLCPSVDRIDSKQGYHLSNMEWITHSENSSRGSLNRHNML